MKGKKEIILVEMIQAVNGKFDQLKKALQEIVPLCRSEKGCLQMEFSTAVSP